MNQPHHAQHRLDTKRTHARHRQRVLRRLTHQCVRGVAFFVIGWPRLTLLIYQRSVDGWHPILVDTVPSQTTSPPDSDKLFRFIRSPTPIPLPAFNTNPRFSSLPVGTRVEYSHASVTTIRQIAKLISNKGNGVGMALLIDYGADHLFGDSFRVSDLGNCCGNNVPISSRESGIIVSSTPWSSQVSVT
jgi:hypothetical protein